MKRIDPECSAIVVVVIIVVADRFSASTDQTPHFQRRLIKLLSSIADNLAVLAADQFTDTVVAAINSEL